MKTSPLQIEHYFVSELHFTVNHAFDTAKKVDLSDDQFVVESASQRNEKMPEKWQVTLRIKHQPIPTANAPYSFTIEIVGLFSVMPEFPLERAEHLVQTNATSILYGLTREVVRNITSSGPYRAVLIPSISFFEPFQTAKAQQTANPLVAPAQSSETSVKA